jgi:hypothetical protein
MSCRVAGGGIQGVAMILNGKGEPYKKSEVFGRSLANLIFDQMDRESLLLKKFNQRILDKYGNAFPVSEGEPIMWKRYSKEV